MFDPAAQPNRPTAEIVAADPLTDVCRDFETPLSVVKGHAQLAARDVLRAEGLSEEERGRLLARLQIVAAAADAMATRLDGIGRQP